MSGKNKKPKTTNGKSKVNNSEKPKVEKYNKKDHNSANRNDSNESRTRNASRDATIYTNVLNTVAERQRIRRLKQENQSDNNQRNTDTSQNG